MALHSKSQFSSVLSSAWALIHGLISFIKPLNMLMLLFSFSLFHLVLSNLEGSFFWSFSSFFSESSVHLNLGLKLGGISSLFLFMVLLVTSFVLLYSVFYMEHYNNYKFIFLLISFFGSMIILSTSSSFTNLMIGWDGLGITSICLIMFYPNKTTSFNSILTMFFNRLGDVILILVLGIFLWTFSSSYEVVEISLVSLFFLMICSFTKSAQFPLSSWLPAAMSAPTPISAMVHSSTLVTAGLFIVSSFLGRFFSTPFLLIVLFFSAFTFLVGGLLANIEKDFKKIVAFSTMSQISMIMFFLSMCFLTMGLFHMIFHAFFKTLLFCCSGVLFMSNFSDQFKKFISGSLMDNSFLSFFLISLFGMSGLTFSSSFFSKDYIIEALSITDSLSCTFTLLLGSIFTIFYCSSLYFSVLSFTPHSSVSSSKSPQLFPFVMFSGVVLLFSKTLCSESFESQVLVGSYFPFFLSTFLLYCCALNLSMSSIKSFYLSFFIWGMKSFLYSKLETGVFKGSLGGNFYSSDLMFSVKNFSFISFPGNSLNFSSMSYFYMLVLSFLLLVF